MTYAVVINNKVVNIVESEKALHDNWYSIPEDVPVRKGWNHDGSEFTEDVENTSQTIYVNIINITIDGVQRSNVSRHTFLKGSKTVIDFELQDVNGNKLPITDAFSVPIQQLKGAVIDSVELRFVNGSATLTETWRNSGEFVITEELINTYIDNATTLFKFDGLAFSVARKGE